jgi:S1-C subfamily serine protease
MEPSQSLLNLELHRLPRGQFHHHLHLTLHLRIGQVVYALGSPLNMERTFTNGILSRQEEQLHLFHTAAIAPGSSGSALLDRKGHLIGINKAVITQFQALSMATPVQALQTLYPNFACKS